MAALLIVSRELIHAAMVEFDTEFRDLPEWADWHENAAQIFAIVQEGRRYPLKK